MTHSYFNAAFTTVADALKSGNCTHIPNAMVYKVLMDPQRNRAKGVLYIDRNTREPKEVNARAVVLCAQSLESVRILLNSADTQYSNGLANSSGVLGHYLMDHITGGGASGEFPDLASKPAMSQPQNPAGMYVARFRNIPGCPSPRTSSAATDMKAEAVRISTGMRRDSAKPTKRRCWSQSAPWGSADSASAWPAWTITWRSTRR